MGEQWKVNIGACYVSVDDDIHLSDPNTSLEEKFDPKHRYGN